jgi:hypothetical protein
MDRDPTVIGRAAAMIRDTVDHGEPTLGEKMWFALLTMSKDTIKYAMLHPGPEGRLLRANSPFSDIIGVTDIGERRALWRQAQNAS